MHDYARVEAIIRYLDSHHAEQPRLERLAQEAGLSSFHLHRLFHRWAGVTPKDFLQCLTLEHARQTLQHSPSVLEAALDAGLSGAGRLHDLTVTLEAASPGEVKSGGAGMTIEWGWATSPFGVCSLAWNGRGICHLAFHSAENGELPPKDLTLAWPKARLHLSPREAQRLARNIFRGNGRMESGVQAFVGATPFQLRVWRALLRIPQGGLTTYSAIARAIGIPNAARAVGAACGANPIAYLIPCHRVIRQTGIVQGYRWGAERKRAMLVWESKRLQEA